jgi:hypothetical protein
MPRVGFEPTIPVLERAKTFHFLDRAATLIGRYLWSNGGKIKETKREENEAGKE